MNGRLINALFAIAALAVPACAIFETQWYRVAPSMRPEWILVSVEGLRAVCGENVTALRNRACVVRQIETRTCFIFSVDSPDAFSEEDRSHEEVGHCRKGKNHG